MCEDSDQPMTSRIKQKKARNIGVELLRGCSILYIVGFWHMLDYTKAVPHYKNIVTYRLTWIVLGSFVFIAGYFCGRHFIKVKTRSTLSFYLRRFMRIYPLYILSLFTFTKFGLVGSDTSLKAALLVSAFLKPEPPTLWFITMLAIFYMIAPLLVRVSRSLKVELLVLIYLVVSGLLLIYWHISHQLDVRIVTYFPAFWLGLLVAVRRIRLDTRKLFVLPAAALGIVTSFITNSWNLEHNWLCATLMVTIVPFVLFSLSKNLTVRREWIHRSISAVAYASFCMYLFHRPIYRQLRLLYFPKSAAAQLIYLVAFCLPVIWLLSYGIQKIYDRARERLSDMLSAG